MDIRSNVRFSWPRRLSPTSPMIDPGLGIDQFQDPNALKVRHRTLARERFLDSDGVDDSVRGESAIEQPLANARSEMIQQPSCETAWSTLDPSVEDDRRQCFREGAPRE